MSDLISRKKVIDILEKEKSLSCGYDSDITIFSIEKGIRELSTAYSVDKVVEELEKRKQEYLVGFGIHDNNEMYGVACGLGDAIEIVKQEAEQFGTDTNVGSNSWIPCSERLPENGGYYLVTYHEWSDGNFLPKYDDTYVRRLHYQISDHFVGWNYPKNVDDRAENDCHKEVIAWQPLPEVYKN